MDWIVELTRLMLPGMFVFLVSMLVLVVVRSFIAFFE